MPASDPLEDTALADDLAAIAREAGRIALQYFRVPVKSWFKGEDNGSPVSEADLAVDAFLKERLAAISGGWGWLSEETEDDPARLSSDRVWVVDPIDGTRAFLAGFADWAISIALVAPSRPIIGMLYAPVTDELFVAVHGRGATLNGMAITVDSGTTIAGARVAGPQRMVDRLVAQLPEVQPVPRGHSLALRFARVAQGQIDIAFAGRNSHDWDLAGADLLVHEAGGLLTTVSGEVIIYNRPRVQHDALLAAGPPRHRIVSNVVAAARPVTP